MNTTATEHNIQISTAFKALQKLPATFLFHFTSVFRLHFSQLDWSFPTCTSAFHLCAFAQVVSSPGRPSLICELVKTQFKCCIIQEEFPWSSQSETFPSSSTHQKAHCQLTADTSFLYYIMYIFVFFQHPNNTLLILSPSSFSNEYIYLNH